MPSEDHNIKEKDKASQTWWQPAIIMFARLSGWIVAPVLIGTIFGKYLDNKYGTEPWLFIISVGLAFVISMVGLGYNVVKEYRKIENEFNKSSTKIENNKKDK